tara:strand:- start:6804 stop:6950 length:147 start_codon:yes stop_codon:yes gene_type:complete
MTNQFEFTTIDETDIVTTDNIITIEVQVIVIKVGYKKRSFRGLVYFGI